MANTYTQIYLHIIFSVQNRSVSIRSEWKQNLYNYITKVVEERNHKMLTLNGPDDHIHIFLGYNPIDPLPELVKAIKRNSSLWLKKEFPRNNNFRWQEGYGCFSCSKSHIGKVANYIQEQERHHQKRSFREEYVEFLEKYGVEYNEKYVADI